MWRIKYILAGILLLFTLTASIIGLLYPGVYNDNQFVKTAWFANDQVTLFIAIPSILVALFYPGIKHSTKAEMVWMGLIAYLLYNYAFYLFGAAFNKLFLLYAGIFSVSIITLIIHIASIKIPVFSLSTITCRLIGSYLLLLAFMLVVIEGTACILFITNNSMPLIIPKSGHPTGIVYALDLTLVVPGMIFASWLLLKKKFWGLVLSVMMLVKAGTYGTILVYGTLLQRMRHEYDPLLPLYFFIMTGGLAGLFFLLKTSRLHASES